MARTDRQRGGFDPDRMADLTPHRPPSCRRSSRRRATAASGFTEVKIVGVGGGGGNAVNRMVEAGVQGVEFIAVNTDAQALQFSSALRKILIGGRQRRGLGAGGNPRRASARPRSAATRYATRSRAPTWCSSPPAWAAAPGTGAAPVVAEIARRARALTVARGDAAVRLRGQPAAHAPPRRAWRACAGNVDALIVIPNDRLLKMADRQMSVVEASGWRTTSCARASRASPTW